MQTCSNVFVLMICCLLFLGSCSAIAKDDRKGERLTSLQQSQNNDDAAICRQHSSSSKQQDYVIITHPEF